jgi:hypothetical protein
MAEIKNIAVHHFAGKLNLSQLNALHKSEWPDTPSKLRPDLWVGYNFVIWEDGSWLQSRYIGEETCAQVGHNFDTVSISLYGNFDITLPNAAQLETLKRFLFKLTSGIVNDLAVLPGTVINIPKTNIFPHRVLQPHHTACYGSRLPDDWARKLLLDVPPPAPTVVAPAPIETKPLPLQTSGPEWTALMQSFQKLLQLWHQYTGKPVGGCIKGANQ